MTAARRGSPDVLRGACPVVGSFGGKDKGLRGAAARLDGALTAAGVPHDVKEYPQASHGFLNDHGTDGRVPPVFAVMAKLSGMGYHEESANDARRRIVAFFAEHLKPLSRTDPAYSRPPSSSQLRDGPRYLGDRAAGFRFLVRPQ